MSPQSSDLFRKMDLHSAAFKLKYTILLNNNHFAYRQQPSVVLFCATVSFFSFFFFLNHILYIECTGMGVYH